MTHLAILQTQVCDSTHRRSLPLGEIFVYLVNAIRDVVVSLVKQVTSANVTREIFFGRDK